jgi:hypothetical protein
MAYKRPIPSKNTPSPLNRKRLQFFPRLKIRLRPSRFPGVYCVIIGLCQVSSGLLNSNVLGKIYALYNSICKIIRLSSAYRPRTV